MSPKLSKRLNTASRGEISNSPVADPSDLSAQCKYFLIQETDSVDTLLKLTLNGHGIEIKAEMPDEYGVLQNALLRWHHVSSELSTSSIKEISEKEFNSKLNAQFSEIQTALQSAQISPRPSC